MIVEPLLLQQLGQISLTASGLFQLGSLVLKPYFDLIIIKAQLRGQSPSPFLRQVSVGVKLVLESVELIRAEGCPRPLVLTREVLLLGLLDLPGPRP